MVIVHDTAAQEANKPVEVYIKTAGRDQLPMSHWDYTEHILLLGSAGGQTAKKKGGGVFTVAGEVLHAPRVN